MYNLDYRTNPDYLHMQEVVMANSVLQVSAGGLDQLDGKEVRRVLTTLKPQTARANPGHLDNVARVVSVVWDVIGKLPNAEPG